MIQVLGLSDHAMIYGFLKAKAKFYPAKVISFRKKLENQMDFKRDMKESMCQLNLDDTKPIDEQYSTAQKFFDMICV